jgi:hypothetical protein
MSKQQAAKLTMYSSLDERSAYNNMPPQTSPSPPRLSLNRGTNGTLTMAEISSAFIETLN